MPRLPWAESDLDALGADNFLARTTQQITDLMAPYLAQSKPAEAPPKPETPRPSFDLSDWSPWRSSDTTTPTAPAPSAQPAPSQSSTLPSFNLADWSPWRETPKPQESRADTTSSPSGFAGSRPQASSGAPQAMPTTSGLSAPSGGGDIDNSSRESFVRTAYPYALQAADGDATLANQLLATAISENGKVGTGQSLGEMGFNVGGIQGVKGTAGSFTALDAGRPRQFAAYNNLGEGFRAVRDLMSSGRYAQAAANYRQTGDIDRYWREVNEAGYSETPTWQDSIADIRRTQVEPLTAGLGNAAPASRPQTQPQAPSAPSQAQADQGGSWEVDQAALDDPDKWSLCGPVAAVMAAAKRGGQWTVAQAKQIASASGLWDAAQGMGGLGTEVSLLNKMGVSARIGQADQATLAADAQAGNTPIISTNRHYFILKGYDPATGKFDTTTSGSVLKGGSRYLTLDEIERLGGGIQGAAYMDNPASPAPSVAVGSPATQDAYKVADSLPETGLSAGDQKRQKLAALQGEQTMLRQPLMATQGPDTATGEYDPRDADSGAHEAGYTVDGGVQPASGGADVSGGTAQPPRPDSVPASYGSSQDDPGSPPAASPYTVVPATAPLASDQGQTVEVQTTPRPADRYQTVAADQPLQSDQGNMVEMPVTRPGSQAAVYGGGQDDPGTPPIPPRVVQASVPSISLPDLTPVYNAAGQLVSYVQHGVQAAADQIGANMAGNRQAVADANAASGTDGIDWGQGAANAAQAVVQNWEPGGMAEARAIKRLGQINAQAAADQGINPNDPRALLTFGAADDPAWRAQNPELAAEYDDLQQQVTMSVGGMVGGGGEAPKPAPKPQQTVEVLQQRLAQARSIVDRLIGSGDAERLTMAQDNAAAIESQLADAVNARRSLEPRIRSDVGQRIEDTVSTESSVERVTDARFPTEGARTSPADLSGPVSIPTDTGSRLNAGFGVLPDEGPRRTPSVPAPRSPVMSPAAQDLMQTYGEVTPARTQAASQRAIQLVSDDIARKVPTNGEMPPSDLVPQIHAAITRDLGDTKVVATGLRKDAIAAYLRGEGITSKTATQDWDQITRITQRQVNVGGGRRKLIDGKLAKVPYTVEDAAGFAHRESEQMRAATGGTRFPDPARGGVFDEAAPNVNYAYVTEGQPLIGPNSPDLWLVWDDATPRITSAHHPYALLSPNQDIHQGMPPGLKAALWNDAVRGGVLERAADGSPIVRGWEQAGIRTPEGRTIADTNWLVGPEGENAMRASGLLMSMPQDVQRAIARGDLRDPDQIAAILMRGGGVRDVNVAGYGAAQSANRSESLVLDPNAGNVKAIYLAGAPSMLNRRVPNVPNPATGKTGMTVLETARAVRQKIIQETGRDVPILFTDTKGGGSKLITDARVLEGPPLSLAPGRADIVDRYTRAGYEDIGASAGTLPPGVAPDRLAAVNRVLGQGVMSAVSGGVGAQVNQQMNPDDPYAAVKGFATGAVAPYALARGGAALGRRFGAAAEREGGALATLGVGPQGQRYDPRLSQEPVLPGLEPPRRVAGDAGPPISDATGRPQGLRDFLANPETDVALPGFEGMSGLTDGQNAAISRALSNAEQRSARMADRGVSRPSAWDWIKAGGYSGIYSPATAVSSLISGVQELVGSQPKEAIRALVQGRPGAYGQQVRAQLSALRESLPGVARVIMGDAAESAASSGGSQGTAGLSDRVSNPVGRFVARTLEKPGEILTEAPDAVFRPLFRAQGEAREASAVAREMGLRGRPAADYSDRLIQDAQAVRNGDLPTMPETQRIIDAGVKHADDLGYKGKPGAFGQWLGSLARRNDPVGVVASFLAPFPGMASRMTGAAVRSTPGAALIPAVRRGYPSKFDMVYDQAAGTLAAAGIGYWAMNGGVTGSGPTDPEQRAQMVAQGWQPNSVLIAGHYIPNRQFGRFQPFLDTAGELHDALAYGKADRTAPQIASELVKRGSKIATDQIGLSGLADLHDMLESGFSSQFPGWAARSITRYLPYGGVIRATAASLDPNQRRADRWQEGSPLPAIGEQLQTAVPVLRQQVPAAQDVLGRPLENPQQGLGAILPRTTTLRNDPVIRLFQDANVDIGKARDQMTVGRVSGMSLKPAEQRRWNELRGQFIQEYSDAYTGNQEFMALPPSQKEKYLKAFLGKAADYADKMLQSEMDVNDLTQRATDQAMKKAVGQ